MRSGMTPVEHCPCRGVVQDTDYPISGRPSLRTAGVAFQQCVRTSDGPAALPVVQPPHGAGNGVLRPCQDWRADEPPFRGTSRAGSGSNLCAPPVADCGGANDNLRSLLWFHLMQDTRLMKAAGTTSISVALRSFTVACLGLVRRVMPALSSAQMPAGGTPQLAVSRCAN
jgi:hypothetical protein